MIDSLRMCQHSALQSEKTRTWRLNHGSKVGKANAASCGQGWNVGLDLPPTVLFAQSWRCWQKLFYCQRRWCQYMPIYVPIYPINCKPTVVKRQNQPLKVLRHVAPFLPFAAAFGGYIPGVPKHTPPRESLNCWQAKRAEVCVMRYGVLGCFRHPHKNLHIYIYLYDIIWLFIIDYF